MFASIVVGTDGSDSARQAVIQAAEMARSTGARLIIVSAYAPVTARVAAGDSPEAEDWKVGADVLVDGVLQDATSATAASGIQVETRAVRGDAADAIIEVAEQEGADLIVVGNKGMTGARRFLLGSVPNKVSHHAPCSVLIVRTG
jgi:nucleotide-binding universal stress UspA family protein